MIIFTTLTFERKNINEYRGVIFDEVINGIDFINDFTSNITSGRSKEYKQELIDLSTYVTKKDINRKK